MRLLLLSTLTFFNLFACSGGYSSCVQKVRDAHALQNNTLFIPLDSKYRLVQSTSKPHADIVKYDPFLALYLVKNKEPFAYPFTLDTTKKSPLAMVSNTKSCQVKVAQRQLGLNTFAKLREPLIVPSLLTTSCCFLAGIVTKRGVIEEEYIEHFLASQRVEYSDMGIRVKQYKNRVFVSAKDPFFENNPLKKEDVIVAMDGKKVQSAALLMQSILFAKVGSKHTLDYLREGKKQKASITLQKRYG
ncbi:MAG: PDZ domain-containing protein, partial [Sulfurimonas sp.]